MPYIRKDLREQIDERIEELAVAIVQHGGNNARPGLMNYALTKLIKDVYRIYPPTEAPRYHEWNEIVGFMECCKLELYRKGIAPYENEKEQENGPVL